jgi:hypothetical protein
MSTREPGVNLSMGSRLEAAAHYNYLSMARGYARMISEKTVETTGAAG